MRGPGTDDRGHVTPINTAHVYKGGVNAGTLTRRPDGVIFEYIPGYAGPAVASTLPVDAAPRLTAAGAVPPFFAGLLPEGRRLTALRQAVKTSADDELSLLAAVGDDTVGDVQVTAGGRPQASVETELPGALNEISFERLLAGVGMARPTLAGVQDKISATMISLLVRRRHQRFILQLNPPENPHLVENEHFFTTVARDCGIPVSPVELVHDMNGERGLLVTRFDRVSIQGVPLSLAVEDACQALDLWPADKYNTTMEEAAASLSRLCLSPVVAARDIVRQVAFAWLTGNGDQHAKNLSVLGRTDSGYGISPAYDLPSTLFYDDTSMALTVGGRDTLTARRLEEFGLSLGIPTKGVARALAPVLKGTAGLVDRLAAAGLPFDRRTMDKVARRLAIRRREFERSPAASATVIA